MGTARTIAGRRSRRGWRIGRARLNGACDPKIAGADAGRIHGRRNVEKNERVWWSARAVMASKMFRNK